MKYKKIVQISLLLGAVVLFGIFSACANTSSVQTEESPSFLEEDISMQAPLEISDDDLSKLLSGALAFDELSQDEVSLDEPSSVILEEDAESNSESISESVVQGTAARVGNATKQRTARRKCTVAIDSLETGWQ